ncbi:MAG: DUF4412 domain-containing protein [candidate division KSB1 bacterium]|nr:DUF4412 domain-containing protein [candidate division KSB1 bacterium]MDZ7357133.1 DUF4412 domain-containing protein [candidate division KSB1 bacterium]MDZ7400201.1 DUF4412 domain-containing protein [candidate division KSB1 bacterium]
MRTNLNRPIKGFQFLGLAIMVLTFQFANAQTFEGYLEQTVITKSTMPRQPSQKTEQHKAFYKSGKFKSADLTNGEDMILRFDKELMWTVNHKEKSYTEMTFADMQKGMTDMQSAMQQEMKKMSPEERKAMEQMLGKDLGKMFTDQSLFEISFKKTGKTKMILGYDCEQVFFNLDDEPIMEMWLTSKLNMGSEWVDIYEKLGMMKVKLSSEARKLRGLPLLTKINSETGMVKIEIITETTRVVKTSISDSEFEVPRGYTKKSLETPFKH